MASAGVTDIPRDLAEVSPAWLSAALGKSHPGVEVSAFNPESLHQGTASTWRLHLDYAEGSEPGPKTVCIKSDFGLPHAERLALTGLYKKEALVYLDLLPATSARVADCYAAGYDDNGRGFMLMEDLAAAGGRFCHPSSALSVAQVAAGVEQLAKLHASTWDAPYLGAPEWMHHGKPLSEEDPMWNALLDRYADFLTAPHAGAMARVFQDPAVVKPAFNRLRTFQQAAARCLIHGDAHVGNFYVDRNGDPGMADFQCVQRGDVAHDLATFIVSALDVVDRRAHERALLQRYLDCLGSLGVAAPEFEAVWLGYRRHLIYSLVTWVFTTSVNQPELDLVTNVFRFGTAALDLDTLELLK
jgi:aminoglycoside phosphotransferase (APT) family kinase protein